VVGLALTFSAMYRFDLHGITLSSASIAVRLQIPHNSMNALMQYLKRKLLVQKTGSALDAPYCLTDKGYEVLVEITRRHAA
jgi:hypothetical protein